MHPNGFEGFCDFQTDQQVILIGIMIHPGTLFHRFFDGPNGPLLASPLPVEVVQASTEGPARCMKDLAPANPRNFADENNINMTPT